MRASFTVWIAATVLAVCGCGADQLARLGDQADKTGAEPADPSAAEPPPAAEADAQNGGDQAAASTPGAPAEQQAPGDRSAPAAPRRTPGLPPALRPAGSSAPPDTSLSETVKADVGVGAKGRGLDKFDSGVQAVIAQPAKSLFAFKERAVFQIQIPQAVQLYKATNGRLPRNHNEYMTQIIKANRIQLPQLPPGQRYQYDPQRGELMVVRPK